MGGVLISGASMRTTSPSLLNSPKRMGIKEGLGGRRKLLKGWSVEMDAPASSAASCDEAVRPLADKEVSLRSNE